MTIQDTNQNKMHVVIESICMYIE